MKKTKRLLTAVGILGALIAALWITGIAPKLMGKQTATRYVNENYGGKRLQYDSIEFSGAYGDYIAAFTDESGMTYNFRLSSGRFPTSVEYDGIKQSVVL